jgi:hypothetical protein
MEHAGKGAQVFPRQGLEFMRLVLEEEALSRKQWKVQLYAWTGVGWVILGGVISVAQGATISYGAGPVLKVLSCLFLCVEQSSDKV